MNESQLNFLVGKQLQRRWSKSNV